MFPANGDYSFEFEGNKRDNININVRDTYPDFVRLGTATAPNGSVSNQALSSEGILSGSIQSNQSHIKIGDRTRNVSAHTSSTYDTDEWYATGLERYLESGTPAGSKQVDNQPSSSYSDSDGYTGNLQAFVYSGLPSDSKHVTNQTSSYYNSGGYSGSLSRYVHSGSYTPSDTKYVSDYPSMTYNQGGYSGTLQRYLKSGHPAGSKTVTNQSSASYSDSEGYRGTLSQYVAGGTPAGSKYVSNYSSPSYSDSEGYTGNLSGTKVSTGRYTYEWESGRCYSPCVSDENKRCYACGNGAGGSRDPDKCLCDRRVRKEILEWRYSGNVSKPDTRVYKYQGTVSRQDTRVFSYRGNVTRAAVDTRVYRYQGTVTRPDTRVYKYRGTVNKPDTRVYKYRGAAHNKIYRHIVTGKYVKASDVVLDYPVNIKWIGKINPNLTNFKNVRVTIEDTAENNSRRYKVPVVEDSLNTSVDTWPQNTVSKINRYKMFANNKVTDVSDFNVVEMSTPLLNCIRDKSISTPRDDTMKLECKQAYNEYIKLNIENTGVRFQPNELTFSIDHELDTEDITVNNTQENQVNLENQTFVTKDDEQNKYSITTNVTLPADIEYEYDQSQQPTLTEETGKKIYTYTARLIGQPQVTQKSYEINNNYFPYGTNVVLVGSDGNTRIELPLKKGNHTYDFQVPKKNAQGRLITYTLSLDGTLYRLTGTGPYDVEIANNTLQVILQNDNPAQVPAGATDLRNVNIKYEPLNITHDVANFTTQANTTLGTTPFITEEIIGNDAVEVKSNSYENGYPFAKWNIDTRTNISQLKNNKIILEVKQDEYVDNVDLRWNTKFEYPTHTHLTNINAANRLLLPAYNAIEFGIKSNAKEYKRFDGAANTTNGKLAVQMDAKFNYQAMQGTKRFYNGGPVTDRIVTLPGDRILPFNNITNKMDRTLNVYSSVLTHNINTNGTYPVLYSVTFNLRENDKFILNHVPAHKVHLSYSVDDTPPAVTEYPNLTSIFHRDSPRLKTYSALVDVRILDIPKDAKLYPWVQFNDVKFKDRLIQEPITIIEGLNQPKDDFNEDVRIPIRINYNSGNGTFTGNITWIGKAYNAIQTLTAKMDGITIGTRELNPDVTSYTFTDIPVMNNDGTNAVYTIETTPIPRTDTTHQGFNVTNRYLGRTETMFIPVTYPSNTQIQPFFVKLGNQVLPVMPVSFTDRPKTNDVYTKVLEFTNVRFDDNDGNILTHAPQVSYNATGPWSDQLVNNGSYQEEFSFFSIKATENKLSTKQPQATYDRDNILLTGNNGVFESPKVEISYSPKPVHISGDVIWENGNPTKRPNLIVQLKVGDEIKEELEIPNNASSYVFTQEYPIKDSYGDIIPYEVVHKPDSIDSRYAYESTNVTKNDPQLGVIPKFDIKMSYVIPKISVTKNIIWKDGIQDNNLKVKFNLIRDGVKFEEQEVVFPTTSHTFNNLDKTDLQENIYNYRVDIETDNDHKVVDNADGTSTIQYVPPKGNLTFKIEVDGGYKILQETGFELWAKYVHKETTGDVNKDEKVDDIRLTKDLVHSEYLDIAKEFELFTIQGLRKEFYIKNPTEHSLFEQTFKNKDNERIYTKKMKFLNDKTSVTWKTAFKDGEVLNVTPKYIATYDTYNQEVVGNAKPNSYINFQQDQFIHTLNDLVKYNNDGSIINWLNNITPNDVPENWEVNQNGDVFLWQYNIPNGTIRFNVQVNAEALLRLLERVSDKETKETPFLDEVKFGDAEAIFEQVPLTYRDGVKIKYELVLDDPITFEMFYDDKQDIYTIQLRKKPIVKQDKDYIEHNIRIKVIWEVNGIKAPFPVRVVSDPYSTDYYNFGSSNSKEEIFEFNNVKVRKGSYRVDWVQPDKYKVFIVDKHTLKVTDNVATINRQEHNEPFRFYALEDPEVEGYYYDARENDESTSIERNEINQSDPIEIVVGLNNENKEIVEPNNTEIVPNLEEERAYLNIPEVAELKKETEISVESNILGSSNKDSEDSVNNTNNSTIRSNKSNISKDNTKNKVGVETKYNLNNSSNSETIIKPEDNAGLNSTDLFEKKIVLNTSNVKDSKLISNSSEIKTEDSDDSNFTGTNFGKVKTKSSKVYSLWILLILAITTVTVGFLIYRRQTK